MASIYKSVEYNSAAYEERTYYKNQNFSNSDEGISSIQFRSESLNFDDNANLISYTTSGSHYNFNRGLLYDSSSFFSYSGLFTNKFFTSGSVIYIPQQYYGEEIKPNSFELIDNSTSQEIKIRDDGLGNLYSTNAINSRSAASSISSSENYVGNIQYQMGVVMITETGSWSGSGTSNKDIMYTDVGTGNYNVKFNSTQCIYQNELILKIDKNDFTATSNQTIWSSSKTATLIPNISSSLKDWSPYATQICFYDRVPTNLNTIYESGKVINAGNNSFVWSVGDLEINTDNIPNQITQIVGTGVESAIQGGNWAGSLDILKQGETYNFNNTSNQSFIWDFGTQDQSLQFAPNFTPLMIANFPRAVKIDKDSDLTIIIRYDT